MLGNFLCADAVMTFILIFDIVVLLGAIGLLVWYFMKSKNRANTKNIENKPMSKVDDETYVIEAEQVEEETPVYEEDNNVVHFVNQIAGVNKERNDEHSANAIVVNHEVEAPVKKMVAKDEIENFVMIGGEKKQKTEEENIASVNRGTDAFKNATNFLNTIKSEQASDNLSSKNVSRKK